MIALEFIGKIVGNAKTQISAKTGKKEVVFPVDVKRVGKDGSDRSIVIHCSKNGVCSSDSKLVVGQKIYVRGDVESFLEQISRGIFIAKTKCLVWQFELL